ncbi:hypothetical protein C2E31_09295 [Rhodopirellula baltica]|nr:hypothetical protein C2E31_09295 [Rhodopirellula baltica]
MSPFKSRIGDRKATSLTETTPLDARLKTPSKERFTGNWHPFCDWKETTLEPQSQVHPFTQK